MKRTSLAVLAALTLVAALSACAPAVIGASASTEAPARQITVNGIGQVYVTPDIAYINVGVRSLAETVTAALEQNNAQARTIKDALIAQGVEEKDIQTSSFNVYPQPEYDFQGQITRNMYAVENTVFLTVRNLQNLSKLLDVVVESGANNIYGINFDLQDKSEAQKTAQQMAVDAGKAKAQELADMAGVKLGKLVSISSFSSYPAPYYGYGMGGGGGMAYDASVPITSGQIQVYAEASMIFEME
jgi:hypothetical protein